MNQDIYVVIEHLQGQVADISCIMLAAARGPAEETGGQVVAVLLGHEAQALANDLAADQVLYLDHPALADFTSDAYLEALAGLISEKQPELIYPHFGTFAKLLDSENNILKWGAIITISYSSAKLLA